MCLIIRTDSENPDFQTLIKELDSDLNSRYGDLQLQYNAYNKVDLIKHVVIAYKDDLPIGCGCFKIVDDHSVELKRMFVKSSYRGTGISGSILSELEQWVQDYGFKRIILETGLKQPEAIQFYQKHGYLKIPNYGQYIDNPNSLCMEKILDVV